MAAIEFGIQPMLFHDASGAPLYAPYPLSIAVPAMMLGHITFAGFAEAAITAGLVAYLQRYDVELLKTTAPGAAKGVAKGISAGWTGTRKLWLGLAAMMIASPARADRRRHRLGRVGTGSVPASRRPRGNRSRLA